MSNPKQRTDEEILQEAHAVEAAVQEAVRRALIVHKALGNAIIVFDREGNPRWIPANEIVIPPSPEGYDFSNI